MLKSHFDQLGKWLNPVSAVFLTFCILAYLTRVLRYEASKPEDR